MWPYDEFGNSIVIVSGVIAVSEQGDDELGSHSGSAFVYDVN